MATPHCIERTCITAALLASLAACTAESPQALAPNGPSLSVDGHWTISGTVSDPTGTPICDVTADVAVWVWQRGVGVVTTSLVCVEEPLNEYVVEVSSGTYFLQVVFFGGGLGMIPSRYLAPDSVVVVDHNEVQDIQVRNGSALGGGGWLDGGRFAGVNLNLPYVARPAGRAGLGISDGTLSWQDGLSPGRDLILQSGLDYVAHCEDMLGAIRITPDVRFSFPTTNTIDCGYTTGSFAAFTHNRTHLNITPLAGDIGGLSPEFFATQGPGYGVQVRAVPGAAPLVGPLTNTDLYRGGLIIAMIPDLVLSGVNLAGYGMGCVTDCHDLGLDGRMSQRNSPGGGRKVTWHYSDATSGEGVGFKVTQRSTDGPAGADYVLFRFTLRNTGKLTRTFYAGFWGDWDVGGDVMDDVGATSGDRHLMYVTNANGGGPYVGTYLDGAAPISGNYFFAGPPAGSQLTLSDNVSAMSGDLRRVDIGPWVDLRYFHALGPLTLRPDQSTDVFLAVVAGADFGQLTANTAVAAAEITRERTQGAVGAVVAGP